MDLHRKPFDEGTIAKLEIFEDYVQAWIPTFVMSRYKSICIFDFFAGTGYDSNKIPGSPIRILKKIREQIRHIFLKKIKVKLFLNEYDEKKFRLLKQACSEYFSKYPEVERAIDIHFYNKDFEICFNELYPLIKKEPSLVYLDQNGVKFLSNEYLLKLEKTSTTDFLYFISSSYVWRFGNTKEFKKHLKINLVKAKENPYKHVHRSILRQIRDKLPNHSELKLYPFSIKKGPNIYGIIFGAKHLRAVDKFLKITWKRNKINGEADFDIDDDETKVQLSLFSPKKKTKLEVFNDKLKRNLLNNNLTSNEEVLRFCYGEGHIGTHAANVLKQLKKNGFIDYNGRSPLITYENVFKSKPPKIIQYKILKK